MVALSAVLDGAGSWPTRRVSAPIDGWCAPGFGPVREAFAANFAERGEVGAARRDLSRSARPEGERS